jgi:hypothetical protein
MHIDSLDSTADTSQKLGWWTPRLAEPLIAAAVLRLALMAAMLARSGIGALSRSDTSSYLIPGRNLLLHGRFFADGVPDLLRTPGYALFLAVTSLAGQPAAALVNVMISVFTIVLIWRLGWAVFGDNRIALGAAWLAAIEPGLVSNSYVLLSDTLFLALLLLSMERLAVFLRARRLRTLAAAGVWLAAATFVRPITLYLPVALALGLLLVLARVPGLRWKAPAVLLISVLPWLSAWQMRNWIETGYNGFSCAGETNLYLLAAANVTARLEGRPPMDVRSDFGYGDFTGNSGQLYLFPPYLALHPEQAAWNQTQRIAYMHSTAMRILRAHPWLYLRVCLTELISPVFSPQQVYDYGPMTHPTGLEHTAGFVEDGSARWRIALIRAESYPWLTAEKIAVEALLLGMYLFAARGVFLAARGEFRGRLHGTGLGLLLGVSLYFLAVTAAMGGLSGGVRYRHPAMPIVCILASAGLRRRKAIARMDANELFCSREALRTH